MTSKVQLKRVFVKIAAFLACALIPAISYASQDTDAMNARASARMSEQTQGSRVYVVKGDVYVAPGKDPAHRVIENEIVASDTLISTGDDSTALLKFEDGQIVTMQANSTFRVRKYHYDAKKVENSSIIFSMLKGGLRFVTGLIGQRKKQAFRLLTPNATLGIRGTEFMVVMVGDSMYSQVQSGKISMTNPAGVSVLGAGQTAVMTSSKALASMVSASAIPAGTFSELISIPLNPSAIPAPAPEPVSIPLPEPIPAPVLAPEPEPPVPVTTNEIKPPPPVVTREEPAGQHEVEERSGMALTGKVGTLGAGAELNLRYSDSLSARFGVNGFKYTYNSNVNSTNYDFNMDLQTFNALADWYPFQGSFRTSGGVFYNNNKVGLRATGGSYTINGSPYPTGISSLQGTVSFNAVAPYLGIGWGNPVATGKGWGLTTDIGILYQGKPRVDMSAACNPLAVNCTQFSADLEAERVKAESDLSNFQLWPVVSIGITYQW